MDKGALADIGFMRIHLTRVEQEIRQLKADKDMLTGLLKTAVGQICGNCADRKDPEICKECLWATWWKTEEKEPEGEEKA